MRMPNLQALNHGRAAFLCGVDVTEIPLEDFLKAEREFMKNCLDKLHSPAPKQEIPA